METDIKMVTSLLNETILAIQEAVPLPLETEAVQKMAEPLTQAEIGVLLGVTGNVNGRLYLHGTADAFAVIGRAMFHRSLAGERLRSFAGELGNIIGDGMATNVLTHRQLQVVITPPTVVAGGSQLYGFDKALSVPIKVGSSSRLYVVLLLAEGKRGE